MHSGVRRALLPARAQRAWADGAAQIGCARDGGGLLRLGQRPPQPEGGRAARGEPAEAAGHSRRREDLRDARPPARSAAVVPAARGRQVSADWRRVWRRVRGRLPRGRSARRALLRAGGGRGGLRARRPDRGRSGAVLRPRRWRRRRALRRARVALAVRQHAHRPLRGQERAAVQDAAAAPVRRRRHRVRPQLGLPQREHRPWDGCAADDGGRDGRCAPREARHAGVQDHRGAVERRGGARLLRGVAPRDHPIRSLRHAADHSSRATSTRRSTAAASCSSATRSRR